MTNIRLNETIKVLWDLKDEEVGPFLSHWDVWEFNRFRGITLDLRSDLKSYKLRDPHPWSKPYLRVLKGARSSLNGGGRAGRFQGGSKVTLYSVKNENT